MSDRFSGDIEQELHETLRRNRLKRARAQFIAEFFDDEELEEINRGRGRHSFSRPGGGNSGGRPDYWESTWGRMLRNQASALSDFNSSASRTFRNRFRVPYPVFLMIVDRAKARFPTKECDLAGRPSIPMELKVLGVLRVLGRATEFDGINELSGIGLQTMQNFFHRFCKWFATEVYPSHVYTPTTHNEAVEAKIREKDLEDKDIFIFIIF